MDNKNSGSCTVPVSNIRLCNLSQIQYLKLWAFSFSFHFFKHTVTYIRIHMRIGISNIIFDLSSIYTVVSITIQRLHLIWFTTLFINWRNSSKSKWKLFRTSFLIPYRTLRNKSTQQSNISKMSKIYIEKYLFINSV